jgi:hypothetical protein
MDRDWTASFSIRFRNGICIIILDKKYNIANSSCHFGSYGSIWTGPIIWNYDNLSTKWCIKHLPLLNLNNATDLFPRVSYQLSSSSWSPVHHQRNIIWTSEASVHIIFFWWRTPVFYWFQIFVYCWYYLVF